jgi:choline dehydrogenase
MLSGVGPADHLKSLGIPVVANIPQIGQNLYVNPTSSIIEIFPTAC